MVSGMTVRALSPKKTRTRLQVTFAVVAESFVDAGRCT